MPTRHFVIILLTLLLALFFQTQGSLKERIFYYALEKVEKTSLEPTTEEKLLGGALDGMMRTSLYYPYSAYLPPAKEEVYKDEINGKYKGIGLCRLQMDAQAGELWFTPVYGSPAQKAGLRFGDQLVRIDGESFTDKKSAKKIFDDLEKKDGEKIRVTIRPKEAVLSQIGEDGADKTAEKAESELQEIEVTRGPFRQEIVLGDRRLENGKWDYSLETHPNLGYIRIDQFTESTEKEFQEALETAIQEKIEGLILDLRWNPGGFLREALYLCDYFLPEGAEVVAVRNRVNGIKRRRYFASDGKKYNLPLVVLINGESASASEIVSAALADNKRAKLVGSRTYGKGTVQELFSLPCKMGLIRLTNASFWRPSDQPIHRQPGAKEDQVWGVTPEESERVSLSETEDYGVLLFRDLRSYPLSSEEREEMKGLITRRMIAVQKEIQKKSKSDEDSDKAGSDDEIDSENDSEKLNEIPVLSGSAPYYDRQLDKAIDVLTEKINPK